MKKIILILICCLSPVIAVQAQFVTYEAVPLPKVTIPKSNFDFKFRQPSVPDVSVVNRDIITTEALCIQGSDESFIIGTKVIVRQWSNGSKTLELIGIKRDNQWNSIDEIDMISIPQALAKAKTKEEKDALLNLSDFTYFAVLGKDCMFLFK